MPATTRAISKRLLSSISKEVELRLPKASSSNATLQNVVGKSKSQTHSKHQIRRKARKRSHQDQKSKQQKPARGNTKIELSDLPSTTVTHWPCHHCDCSQGVFELLVPLCVNCGHEMNDHAPRILSSWNTHCPYICERPDLVSSVLQLALNTGMAVIRATPLVGKTTLLQRKDNAKYRPHNPDAKIIYLVDEAQGSYEDEEFWISELKNRYTRSRSIFVLVCLYGAAGISEIQEPFIQSQASKVDDLNRIELRPSKSSSLCMLFRSDETLTAVSKWILENGLNPGSVDRVAIAEYLHSATDGHPGMIGLILGCFEMLISQNIQNRRRWSPVFCHEILVEHDFLLEFLNQWGRGVWTVVGEKHLKNYLVRSPSCSHLKYSDVTDAMRKVARLPKGYTEPGTNNMNALAFCYKMGFLHAEHLAHGSSEITYNFASPIHRRYVHSPRSLLILTPDRIAYRRLIPGPPPGSVSDTITLQQACLNAIERFSPSVLHHRSPSSNTGCQSDTNWGIPEAVFQDEMYCCLNQELHNLPILSEYAETKDGRIDFFIFGKKWGIEILQSGNHGRLEEHANRFKSGGKYHKWGILEDYIILNFCPKSSLDVLEIKDVDTQSHIRHVVIDANERIAQVYTYDKQLQTVLNLGEGRTRSHSPEEQTAPGDSDIPMALRDQKIELEQENERHEEALRTIYQLKLTPGKR
ncbi:uncharacterized protein Bfra_005674 [Botrytis fragariae]|uniref:Uncharacterized protein n=1 Tax=Botrytis fragariae TaxID=1964551 RepID=A0A8H6ARJ4_9HELO|nr:uncharacterized protein Bfra_005674 [Botrytis fragariae]KAF5872317.1 hypothetical protein Bfra_005674 [Botrytis fragariae]